MTIFFCLFIVDILILLAKQQQQKSVNLYTISACYAWALEELERAYITCPVNDVKIVMVTLTKKLVRRQFNTRRFQVQLA
jgi:hypothetical protein